MELSEFKEELGKLNPPWLSNGYYTFRPLDMSPKTGHVLQGKWEWIESKFEELLQSCKELNKNIKEYEHHVVITYDEGNVLKLYKNEPRRIELYEAYYK